MKYNTSYSRVFDGIGDWEILEGTPGKTNEGSKGILLENLDSPVFSVKSGFYKEPFSLEIKTKGKGNIYYTLDGSEPTMESALYTEPIAISDASMNENFFLQEQISLQHSIQRRILTKRLRPWHYFSKTDPVR